MQCNTLSGRVSRPAQSECIALLDCHKLAHCSGWAPYPSSSCNSWFASQWPYVASMAMQTGLRQNAPMLTLHSVRVCNVCFQDGTTPLHAAAAKGSLEGLKLLLPYHPADEAAPTDNVKQVPMWVVVVADLRCTPSPSRRSTAAWFDSTGSCCDSWSCTACGSLDSQISTRSSPS